MFHFGSDKSMNVPLFLAWSHWIGNRRYPTDEEHLSKLQQGWPAAPSEGGCSHPTWGLQCPKQNNSSPFHCKSCALHSQEWCWHVDLVMHIHLLRDHLEVMYLKVKKGVCSALILGNAVWQRGDVVIGKRSCSLLNHSNSAKSWCMQRELCDLGLK